MFQIPASRVETVPPSSTRGLRPQSLGGSRVVEQADMGTPAGPHFLLQPRALAGARMGQVLEETAEMGVCAPVAAAVVAA